jgi:hypothetical protein
MTMMTNLVQPPTESPRIQRAKSDPHALREWGEFLAPKELETQRLLRETIGSAARELRRTPVRKVRTWDQDKLIDFALNASYPDDIEEQIEQSWRR